MATAKVNTRKFRKNEISEPVMVRLKTKETPNAIWEEREVPHAHAFAVANNGCFFRAVIEDIEFGTILSEFRDPTRN